jgi:hypothetical protein
MIFTITVTAAHIARGKPQEACDCPVWHAITETLPWLLAENRQAVSVGPADVCICPPLPAMEDEFTVVIVELAAAAREAVSRFDSGQVIEPFEFGLDIPDHLVPAGFVPAGGEH